MPNFLLTTFVMSVFATSLYGLGRITIIASKDSTRNYNPAFIIALGMAALIFTGGVLNALSLAYGLSLDLLLILGILITSRAIYIDFRKNTFSFIEKASAIFKQPNASYIILAYSSLFITATLSPSTIFNFHDDLHTYVPRIPQMLETGSLGTNPFGLLGADSLGAQAFLQAFMIQHLGFSYINTFDATFCFILTGLLIIDLAKKLNCHWLVTLSATIAFITLNTQQVNISSIYSSTLMILGLCTFCVIARTTNKGNPSVNQQLPLLLFLSALIALKLLSAFFAATFFLALLAFRYFDFDSTANNFRSFFKTGIALTFVTLPWFLTHSGKYLTAFSKDTSMIDSTLSGSSINLTKNISNIPFNDFFRTNEEFWGGSLFAYNSLFFLTLLAAIFIGGKLLFQRQNSQVLVAGYLSTATALTYTIGMLIFEYQMALRYSLPLLAGTIPVLTILLFNNNKMAGHRSIILSLCLQLFLLQSFLPSLISRVNSAYTNNTILQFPINDSIKLYLNESFSERSKQKLASLQNLTEEDTGLMTWISAPFLLDYSRNKIINLAEPATLVPWFDFPLNGDVEKLKQYLFDSGTRYILWEYQGTGMKSPEKFVQMSQSEEEIFRKLGTKVIKLREAFQLLALNSKVLYHSKGVILFDLNSDVNTTQLP